MTRKDFSRSCRLPQKLPYCLWRDKAKSDTTHCERLCPAGAVAPSFTCWPTARLFSRRDLRNSSWTVSVLLCPQNLKNLKSFYSYQIWIYLYRIRGYLWLLTPQKLFIHTGYELFTPHWKLMTTIDLRRPSYWSRIYLYRVRNINTGSKIIFISVDSFEDFIRVRSSLLPNCIH